MTRNQTPFDRSLVEGPLGAAVWKLAWPTLLQNVVAGLQGIVDHVMVGHYVGFTGNAAIGVAWQIFLVVVVFIASLSSGMTVLVARAAGAGESERVNRVVYQGLLAGALMYVLLAGIGYVAAPHLLTLVNATEAVRDEALPYLRIMFVFSIGMLMFYLLGGALRAAGDARTPLRLGLIVTVLNLVFNVILIRGLGPVPAFGTTGAAMGTVAATGIVSSYAVALLFTGKLPIHFTSHMGWRPDAAVIRSLFRFGLPTGFQGIAMNVGGIVLLGYVGSLELSAEAQAVFAVGYAQLFSLIAWSSNALMQASAALAGQNLGAGRPDRTRRVPLQAGLVGWGLAIPIGASFWLIPERLLALFGMTDPVVVGLGSEFLAYLSVSGLLITLALSFTGALQGTGDTKSPMYISIVSQLLLPLGICAAIDMTRSLEPADIWLAIVLGHAARCSLSILRFRQERWREIEVDTGS